MREPTIPIRDHYIERLVETCPGTAADVLPFVIWVDIIFHDTGCISSMTGNVEMDLQRVDRNDLTPSAPFIWRHCDFFSVYIVRQGRGTHIIEGVPYGVARGDVYTMGIGMSHRFSQCDYLELETLHFSPHIFDPPTLDALSETPGFQSLFLGIPSQPGCHQPRPSRWFHLTPDAYARVGQMVTELRAEWQAGTPISALLTRGLLLRLLTHLSRLYTGAPEAPSRDPVLTHIRGESAIAAAVRYMDENYIEPLRTDELAEMVFLSPDRFREVFSAVMGCTPRDYLRYLRLEHAKTLLSTTDQAITDIAQQTGFGEVTYFNRVFRAMTGMTPSAYRKCVP